ncbi:MAG: hypothetical protein VX589_02030 [Myxococcota bacterium]|nr:hypothetical protein [Myxococcota bacterium]
MRSLQPPRSNGGRVRSILVVCAFVLTMGAIGACSEEPAFGRVYGSLSIPDCEDPTVQSSVCVGEVDRNTCDAFDLGISFFSLQSYPNHAAKVRFQKGGSDFALTDGLLFEIRDIRELRGRLGSPLTVGRDENIRAGLGLFDRCPESTLSFDLEGSIVFEEFGVSPGAQISGRIEGLEVRDGRAEGAGNLLGYLQGHFQFTVRAGPPYQRFQE